VAAAAAAATAAAAPARLDSAAMLLHCLVYIVGRWAVLVEAGSNARWQLVTAAAQSTPVCGTACHPYHNVAPTVYTIVLLCVAGCQVH
jgi:hypothetical protein